MSEPASGMHVLYSNKNLIGRSRLRKILVHKIQKDARHVGSNETQSSHSSNDTYVSVFNSNHFLKHEQTNEHRRTILLVLTLSLN